MDFMRLIQAGHISLGWGDIAYNFLVGGDGVVYAGTGWNREGHHSLEINNNKSVAIAFLGNFNNVVPTPGQMKAGEAVVDVGLRLHKLDSDVYVVLQSQIRPFQSPGLHVEKIVKTEWPQWSPLGDIDVETPYNFTARYFNRSDWFAADPKIPLPKQPNFPLHSVVVYYTENFNQSQRNSLKTMMELQNFYQNRSFSDVPSNFLIFADGCIFEGRGWDYIGERSTNLFDNSTLKFALRVELVSLEESSQKFTPEMNTSLTLLLEESVKIGKLISKYKVYEFDVEYKYRRWLTPLH
uniref:Peptidoglycan recognition protein family domain-containing protein n=1 Tax=Lygus hesperus TaxID=30085 RepID=A0A0K8SF81_LYGHE